MNEDHIMPTRIPIIIVTMSPDASTHPKLKCMAMSTHSINNNDINNGKFIDDVLIIGNNK